MKLEVGKYYLTRDGMKVGPMVFCHGYATYVWDDGSNTGWTVDGRLSNYSVSSGDLIAEWTDTPEVGTLKEIGVKPDDTVEAVKTGFQCKVLRVLQDKVMLEPCKGWFAEVMDNEKTQFRIISRATQAQPSPVRTVTTTQVIPGEYGCVKVHDPGSKYVRINVDAAMDVDALTAAIATLTSIRDAMQANTTA